MLSLIEYRQLFKKSVRRLADLQQADGTLYLDPAYGASAFPTSMILNCLTKLPVNEPLSGIMSCLAKYLFTEHNKKWRWNYDSLVHTKYGRYPDDLDDTICALTAIYQYDPSLLSPEVLAQTIVTLTFCEVEVGGPYRTWIVPRTIDPTWLDVDLVVNANIAYFFSLLKVSLPGLEKFVERALVDREVKSPYYPGKYYGLYAISRWYRGPKRNQLLNQLDACLEKVPDDGLIASAQVLSSLLRLGYPKPKLVHLVNFITSTLWQPEPTYLEAYHSHTPRYVGSEALTTAFCLEALELYYVDLKTQPINLPDLSFEKKIADCSPQLSASLSSQLQRTYATQRKLPIFQLPFLTKQAIGSQANHVSKAFTTSLGMALVAGWTAYTISDDLVDQDVSITTIPSLTWWLRETDGNFSDCYKKAPLFAQMVSKTLQLQDEAMVWELAYCRMEPESILSLGQYDVPTYGQYQQLANRSLGYWLGAAGVASASNWSPTQLSQLEVFFRHLIIARQLLDDAHDVIADWQAGRLTSVISLILQSSELAFCSKKELLPRIRQLFWQETIQKVAIEIENHTRYAREVFNQLPLENPDLFLALLTDSEEAINQALQERQQTIEFITSYQVSR